VGGVLEGVAFQEWLIAGVQRLESLYGGGLQVEALEAGSCDAGIGDKQILGQYYAPAGFASALAPFGNGDERIIGVFGV